MASYNYIYGCFPEENPCEKKEQCARIDIETKVSLWKKCCNKDNNYILFIEKEVNDTE